jgi:hypothetical protein
LGIAKRALANFHTAAQLIEKPVRVALALRPIKTTACTMKATAEDDREPASREHQASLAVAASGTAP